MKMKAVTESPTLLNRCLSLRGQATALAYGAMSDIRIWSQFVES